MLIKLASACTAPQTGLSEDMIVPWHMACDLQFDHTADTQLPKNNFSVLEVMPSSKKTTKKTLKKPQTNQTSSTPVIPYLSQPKEVLTSSNLASSFYRN